MAEGWTSHQADCNTSIAHTAEHVTAVPSAWQSLASPAQWKTQKEAFPAYLVQHRNANGTITQTIVPAVSGPARKVSVFDDYVTRALTSARQVQGTMADDIAHVQEHGFTLKLEYLSDPNDEKVAQAVEYVNLLAPDHMIHANSSSRLASAQARSRNTTGHGFTYWVGADVTSNRTEQRHKFIAPGAPKEPLSVPDHGFDAVPGMVRLTLNADNRKEPIVVEALLAPMDDFVEQVRDKLGHHLRQHLQTQYRHKVSELNVRLHKTDVLCKGPRKRSRTGHLHGMEHRDRSACRLDL